MFKLIKHLACKTLTHLPHNHKVVRIAALGTHTPGVSGGGRGWCATDGGCHVAASAHADVVACSDVERVARPRREADRAFVHTQD